MPEFEDLPRLDPADEQLEGSLDGLGVGALTSKAERVFEKMLVKRKTCTFHAYSVAIRSPLVKH